MNGKNRFVKLSTAHINTHATIVEKYLFIFIYNILIFSREFSTNKYCSRLLFVFTFDINFISVTCSFLFNEYRYLQLHTIKFLPILTLKKTIIFFLIILTHSYDF